MFVLCGVYSLDEVSIYIVEAYWMGGTPPCVPSQSDKHYSSIFFLFYFQDGKKKRLSEDSHKFYKNSTYEKWHLKML
jgi:hypothetical protein